MKGMPKQPTNTLKYTISSYEPIEVPYHVWRFFGTDAKVATTAGDQACLGCDYGSLEELRTAVDWYANQLGGKVKWEK
jgi:hypothetical protein